MNRTPPSAVTRALRKEVGFGCPVDGCGNPYLYWHHFDPPWNERNHHDPAGMIALCAEHHSKADAGAFSLNQLRELKKQGRARAAEVRGRFDWMRRELLAVVGGNFYYQTPVILEFRGESAIWFNRDDDGYLLLNVRVLTTSGQPRVRIEDNYWLPRGDPDDLVSPPSGKSLRIQYSNGDLLQVEFAEIMAPQDLVGRYPTADGDGFGLPFPLTTVEVRQKVGGTNIEFGPSEMRLPGNNVITGCFFQGGRVAIALG